MKKSLMAWLLAMVVCAAPVAMAENDEAEETKDGKQSSMKIKLTSVFVEDQDKAIKFYTEVLGFVKKQDVPVGEFKWLTVVSPDDPDGTELLLEPNDNPAAKTYQQAIFEQGIPATMFFVDDISREVERLKNLGVVFTMEPTEMGTVTVAVFDDTCGNLIQIAQE
jgi:catechol 2,3-dioxygenase-like lactoylglutathione lyase family enzyme